MDPELGARREGSLPQDGGGERRIAVERRPYFVFGDVVASLSTGALVGVAVAGLVGSGWNMAAGMVVGMVLGMLLALITGFVAFFILFGLMEVMIPTMLTGMVAGMWVGMAAAMNSGMGSGRAALLGAEIGLAVLVFTYAANALIRARGKKWTS